MVKPLVSPALLARGFGKGTDFEVYTGAATADESVDRPIVRMIGSSTVKDLQGDIMTITALEDMTKIDPEMTIWLNHRYDVPDDVFGKLAEQPAIRLLGGIADLHLAAEADFSRPVSKARDVYTQISKGKIRQGCSIGCQVLDYSFADDNDPFSPILIHRVYTVEFSIVGIPANQRAWVENAVKGLFSRALVEGRGEDALRLAPAMKSMFWRDYDTTLRYIETKSLRSDLEHVQERGAASPRIIFNFDRNKGFEGFALLGSEETLKPLTFAETQDLLNKGASDLDTENYDPDTTKAACGKTSWPLAEIGTEWTGSKAKSEIFEWAGGDDFSPSKAKQGFLYCGDDPKVRSSYKMPFCYKGDSGLKIVPLGVRACANVLSGGRGGGDFGGADGAMKSRVKTMYGRINSQFHPDPEWVVPWDKDEKSLATHYEQALGFEVVETVDQGETFFGIKGADGELIPWLSKGILDTENGSDLIRQDLEDEVERDEEHKGVTINDDGSHEKMTGKHNHKHPNYGNKADGDMHSHQHEHQDDADHPHSHEKSAEDEVDKQADVNLEEKQYQRMSLRDETWVEDEQGEFVRLGYTSSGVPITTPIRSLPLEKQQAILGQIDVVVTQNAPTPEQLAYLSLYNDLGKRLGFPEHTLETKCNLVDNSTDAQSVISMLSALDGCADSLLTQACQVSSAVDTLMSLMKIPDMDGMGAYASLYSLERAATSLALTVKEGKEISGKNASLVQNIHDTAAALHPPCCKGVSGDGTARQGEGTTVAEAQEEAHAMGQGQGYDNLASLNAMGITMKEFLTKSFEGLNVKALVEQKVNDAVDAAMSEQRANLELINREQQVVMHNVARLKNLPLGRPTNLSGRTVTPKDDERVATYEEMLSAGDVTETPGTLAELEAYTEIVEKDIYTNGSKIKSRYRHWPESVGGTVTNGLRPPLTGNQRSLMLPEEWSAYSLGAACDVPLLDDPFAR